MSTMAPTSRSRNGFTLVEVLVALMIMSVIAVMAWQGVDGIVRTRDASQQRLEKLLRLNTVLAQFEADLDAMQDTGALPGPLPRFDGISLRLTRRAEKGVQLVVWSLRGGTWLRWASKPVVTTSELQDLWINSQQFIGSEAGQLRAQTGISAWQMYYYYYGSNGWSNAQSSAGTSSTSETSTSGTSSTSGTTGTPGSPALTSTNALSAVRLVLTFAEGSDFNGSITREIALGPQ
jgi:general secretion pathway protein J